jgi:hypothetical protein
MMTSNVASNNNNNNIKRRESSIGEDSGVQIDHDSTGKTVRSSNLVPSISKTINTTTAPNPRSGPTSTKMVASSTLIPPPKVDAKSSISTLVPRKDSNTSNSGAYSEASRSFGQEENSSDSLFSHPSSHYVIRCNVNPTTPTLTPSVTLTPRVKVTVQQPSITNRSSRFDSSSENNSPSSSSLLQTPIPKTLPIMTTSTTSSAPEFSVSGTSSVEDSDELASYDQYLPSHGRQSNPSPELRKKNN